MFDAGILSFLTNPRVNPLSALIKSLSTLSDSPPNMGVLGDLFASKPEAANIPFKAPNASQAANQPNFLQNLVSPPQFQGGALGGGMPQPQQGAAPQIPQSPMPPPVQVGGAVPPPQLPNDKQAILQNLKGIAGQTFPDNPNMQKVALAQAILESGLMGNGSALARMNNLFGIKAPGTAGSVKMPTKEFMGGAMQSVNDLFGTNNSIADSFNQYKNLLNKSRYSNVLKADDPMEAFRALQKSGYATDPNYANKLNQIFNKYIMPLY